MKNKHRETKRTANVNVTSEIAGLLFNLQCGKISIDDVSEDIQEMARKFDILRKHESYCRIWQATDGRWKTKLPDENAKNKCRLIAKTSKEDLATKIKLVEIGRAHV